MPIPHEVNERRQFQVDRIAFFSDAVIAIAITLLILELKIPALGKQADWAYIRSHFGHHIITSLLALFLCFYSVGTLWIRHHELFQHIRNYSIRMIRVNLYLLLAIMFLPLSISLALEDNNPVFLCHVLRLQNTNTA